MFGLMGDVAAKISSNNAMPRRVVFFIEFFLDKSCDIFFYVEFLKCLNTLVKDIFTVYYIIAKL